MHCNDWCWSGNSNFFATWCEELTHWKGLQCWERLKAGEGDNRGWDSWMASPTQSTWVWASSGSWWWKGSLSILTLVMKQCAAVHEVAKSQTGLSDWTELNWELDQFHFIKCSFQLSIVILYFFPLVSFLPSTDTFWAYSMSQVCLDKSWNKTGSCLHGTYTLMKRYKHLTKIYRNKYSIIFRNNVTSRANSMCKGL